MKIFHVGWRNSLLPSPSSDPTQPLNYLKPPTSPFFLNFLLTSVPLPKALPLTIPLHCSRQRLNDLDVQMFVHHLRVSVLILPDLQCFLLKNED